MKVKQPGHVIRIASGCEPEEADAMQLWFNENIQYMSKRFHLMLTPHFSQVKNEKGEVIGDYKFFNKPYGLKYWLENFNLLGYKDGGFANEDDVVILIDPDMALLRPITSDFSSERDTVISEKRRKHLVGTRVEHGKPFAQTYGLGTQWQKFDLDKIAGEDSPAKQVNKEDGALYFPVGPPYLGTVRDMYQIALKWTEFVPKVHAQYPYLLAEMYAYCIAAAHLELRHQIVDSLMISNTDTGGEGWPLVDKIPSGEMCEFAAHPDQNKYALPSVVHLCQRYSVGNDWFFGKRKIPHDIYECDTPLFIEPPKDLATLYTFKRPPNAKEQTDLSPKIINQESFMICFLTTLINEASMFYKANACSGGKANLKRSRTVADLFLNK
jgi:peptidyl serine alpha-galactosyltransferase